MSQLQAFIVSVNAPSEVSEASCPVDGDENMRFRSGDQVVQCPICGRWYHTECWSHLGDRCGILNCGGNGAISQAIQPVQSNIEPDVNIVILSDESQEENIPLPSPLPDFPPLVLPDRNLNEEIKIFSTEDAPIRIRLPGEQVNTKRVKGSTKVASGGVVLLVVIGLIILIIVLIVLLR